MMPNWEKFLMCTNYEAQLRKSKYLACDCFTLADLNHIPSASYFMGSRVRKVFDAHPLVVD